MWPFLRWEEGIALLGRREMIEVWLCAGGARKVGHPAGDWLPGRLGAPQRTTSLVFQQAIDYREL